ncbi:MAG: PorV/PorQ family protein [Ignavibacteria bacterium]|jgi:hypothetical protein|nr:PorV/PorQ family protein [Ignavibacteria bacterium]
MHFKRFFYFSFFLILIFASELPAQGILGFANDAGSTSTYGMGEEGVALRNGQDAFTYNPANLTFSKTIRLSFFHNPWQVIESLPMNNLTAAFKLKGIGSFGLQFIREDFMDVAVRTSDNPLRFVNAPSYGYALSLGYAAEVADGLSLGLSLKYGKQVQANLFMDALLLSMGLNYEPAVFNKRVDLGFSLMNMGNPVKFKVDESVKSYRYEENYPSLLEYEWPVPSMMHFGLNAAPLETDYVSAKVQLGMAKYLVSKQEGKEAKSSLTALFNDWNDFPRDASISTGLAFEWKPLDLGNGLSFYQNFFLGAISPGPKMWTLNNFFTHGAEIGIGYKEFTFLMGYSGRWHDVGLIYNSIMAFPWESFQFSLEWSMDKYVHKESNSNAPAALKNILVSLGSGFNFRTGHLIPPHYEMSAKSRNGLSYMFEAAFYMNSNNALISAFYYTNIPFEFEYERFWGRVINKDNLETFGIYSAYRYHPLDAFQALYVQGGPGIVRLNPVVNYSPRYQYQASLNMAAGANLDLFNNNVLITPELNYQLMFVPLNASKAPRLGGENQIALAVKAGYRF